MSKHLSRRVFNGLLSALPLAISLPAVAGEAKGDQIPRGKWWIALDKYAGERGLRITRFHTHGGREGCYCVSILAHWSDRHGGAWMEATEMTTPKGTGGLTNSILARAYEDLSQTARVKLPLLISTSSPRYRSHPNRRVNGGIEHIVTEGRWYGRRTDS